MKTIFPIFDISSLSQFKRDDVLISRFAPYLESHPNLFIAHKHNFYHFVLFTEGAGSHTIDFQNFPVKPHQIYFMIPGQVHTWNFQGKIDGYVINFSNQFFQSLLLKADYLEQFPFFCGVATDSVINLPDTLQAKVLDLFESLLLESGASKRLGLDMIKFLMLQLFILIGRLSLVHPAQQITSYNYTLLKKFQFLIEKNYNTLRSPKEYAELLSITPNHLNSICNEVLGHSAGVIVRDRIMLEAKRLLINSSCELKKSLSGHK